MVVFFLLRSSVFGGFQMREIFEVKVEENFLGALSFEGKFEGGNFEEKIIATYDKQPNLTKKC